MTIRNEGRTEIDIEGKVDDFQSKQIRDFLLDQWKAESQGVIYRYFVETLQSGKRVYLERPARLNKGCDFVIYVEDLLLFKNGNDKPPSFEELNEDLRKKAKTNRRQFNQLVSLIEMVYECKPFNTVLTSEKSIKFRSGWSSELIFKLAKWFFIEQDITYWNRTGRSMLWKKIQSI